MVYGKEGSGKTHVIASVAYKLKEMLEDGGSEIHWDHYSISQYKEHSQEHL